MSDTIHNLWLNRDNTIQLVLVADDVPVSVAGFTRVVITINGTTLDSDALGLGSGQPFDVGQTKTVKVAGVTYADQSVLTLDLGGQTIAAGRDDHVELVVYDATYTAGLVWTGDLRIAVREEA